MSAFRDSCLENWVTQALDRVTIFSYEIKAWYSTEQYEESLIGHYRTQNKFLHRKKRTKAVTGVVPFQKVLCTIHLRHPLFGK